MQCEFSVQCISNHYSNSSSDTHCYNYITHNDTNDPDYISNSDAHCKNYSTYNDLNAESLRRRSRQQLSFDMSGPSSSSRGA